MFTGAAVIGALAGGSLAGHANPRRLSAAFTLLIILVAGYTLTRSLPRPAVTCRRKYTLPGILS
ncbi:MAG: hypothetical protein ACLPKE_06595 [Streptosporangiaceae bacterium]